MSLDETNIEDVKYWFATVCQLYCLFYVYNMKNICDVKLNKEVADAKEQIKRCLKIFISNKIIQSKGYYSYFNPHPNYCENPPEKCEYFKNSKKEYEKLLENNQINEIDDKYFPFVLYMILADFKEDVMPKETGLTRNYFYHLLNLSAWIAYLLFSNDK